MVVAAYDPDEDQFRATRDDGQARVRVYRPDHMQVVLGRGSKEEEELNLDHCLADGVTVVRRTGGGCAVVLDPGQVIVSYTRSVPGFAGNQGHFDRITASIIQALAELGAGGLRQAGISDLALGERKVGGACLHRSRDVLHYSLSLLVMPQVESMTRYLAHPPREPDYRQGRSHSDFVVGLASRFPEITCAGLETQLPALLGTSLLGDQ